MSYDMNRMQNKSYQLGTYEANKFIDIYQARN